MKKFAEFVQGRPKLVLSFLFVITLIMGYGLSKLETKNNQESELPKDDPIVLTNKHLESVFGKKDVLIIGIESNDIFTTPTLNKIVKLSEELKKVDGVLEDEISSIATINNIQGKDWGLEVGPLMEEAPTTPEGIQTLKKEILNNELIQGKLISKNGKFTAIVANMKEGYDQTIVSTQVQTIVEKYKGNEKFFLAGSPITQHDIDSGIEKDINLLLPIGLLMTLIGFFFAFRSVKGVVLPFIVVLLTIIWTMGSMGLMNFPVTVVSSAIPLLMIAISNFYGIHVLQSYYEEVAIMEKPAAIRSAIKKVGFPIFITGISSAIGSVTLISFKVTSIQDFGVITAMGIVWSIFIAILFIPAILALSKKGTDKINDSSDSKKLSELLMKLSNFSIRNRYKVLGFSVVVLAISIYGITKVKVGVDFIEYFPKDHSLRTTFNKLNENLGGARSLDIMIEAKEPGMLKKPEFLKKIADFQKYAEAQAGVGSSNSFSNVVKKINLEMHDGNQTFNAIPDSENTIAQYLLLYSMSGDAADFDDLVDYDYQRAKIKFFLTTSEQDDHLRIYESFKKYTQENFGESAKIEFGGEVMFWLAQIRYIVQGKVENILYAILSVLVLCMFTFRSVKIGVLSIIPLTVSSIITFGLMGFLGMRLETGTAIITSIGIGIGIDFAMHYLLHFLNDLKTSKDVTLSLEHTMVTTGKAIVYDSTSNILCFMVFVFSGFLPIQYFGWLISFTMLTVSFGTLVMFPALFSIFKPKYNTTDTDENNFPDSNNKSDHSKTKVETLEEELA